MGHRIVFDYANHAELAQILKNVSDILLRGTSTDGQPVVVVEIF
jgi:hypothetical protein